MYGDFSIDSPMGALTNNMNIGTGTGTGTKSSSKGTGSGLSQIGGGGMGAYPNNYFSPTTGDGFMNNINASNLDVSSVNLNFSGLQMDTSALYGGGGFSTANDSVYSNSTVNPNMSNVSYASMKSSKQWKNPLRNKNASKSWKSYIY